MQTICEATQRARDLNFSFMPKNEKKIPPPHPRAKPLFDRLGRGGAADVADQLNVSEQVVSNWRRRGVPAKEVGRVAAVIGITYEQYMLEVGGPAAPKTQEAEAIKALRDAIPEWRSYVLGLAMIGREQQALFLRTMGKSLPTQRKDLVEFPSAKSTLPEKIPNVSETKNAPRTRR